MNVVLDCNIYDKLADDEGLVRVIQEKTANGQLVVIATRRLWDEICNSPHRDLALSLNPTHFGESVMFADGCVGDRVGSAKLYDLHLGDSNKVEDALIADAADYDADYLVSEDLRLRRQMTKFAVRCKAISFDEFSDLMRQ
jgi:hypothetical protein